MAPRISRRMAKPDFPGEFVDSMLKAATVPNLISFGGGFPNPIAFPIEDFRTAADKVLRERGVAALQYHATAGYAPLREYIAKRYFRLGVDVKADEVVITNGSQQCLDMIAACLLDPGDEVVMEKPTYLVALQTFHLYEPRILSVDLNEDGIDTAALEKVLAEHDPKFMYVVPDFQNPTGLTYSEETRKKVAQLVRLRGRSMYIVEDEAYAELRFRGEQNYSFGHYLPDQTLMVGTFSKVISPGVRIGWVVCKDPILLERLLAYKQIMDLHTNIFSQMVIAEYLAAHDLEEHTAKIKALYQHQADVMVECIGKYMPEGTTVTRPDGGMFMWVTLPEGVHAVDVQYAAIPKGVLICAGDPFYETERNVRSMRINFTNSSDEIIEKGVKRLAEATREVMARKK